jgi:hypothetical protein
MIWRWWTNRNKINAKEKVGGQENVVAQTRFWAGECKVFCSKVRPVETTEWKTPSGDRLKINIDGAFAASTRTGGVSNLVPQGGSHTVAGPPDDKEKTKTRPTRTRKLPGWLLGPQWAK